MTKQASISDVIRKLAKLWLTFLIIMGVFSPLLVNEVPIFEIRNKKWSVPVLNKKSYFLKDTFTSEPEFVIPSLFRYQAGIQLDKTIQSPSFQYWMGTDGYGRDLRATFIIGSGITLFIAVSSVLVALLISLFMGLLSGFYGNSGYHYPKWGLLVLFIIGTISYYFLVSSPYFKLKHGTYIWAVLMLGGFWLLSKIGGKSIVLPMDNLVRYLLSVHQSLPGLLWVLLALLIFPKISLIVLILLISFLRWPGMTRLIRGETKRIINLPYLDAAKMSGLSDINLMVRHIMPNLKAQIYVALIFSLGNVIILEASLSFLGLGLGPDVATWGNLIAQSREYPQAWWLVIWPGIFISITVMSLYALAKNDPIME
jgi:peptide/nickel transport system permease protein